MRRWLGGLVVLLLLVGCVKVVRPQGPKLDKDAVAEVAWQRPVLDPVRARFTIKLRSDKLNLAGTTNGVMFLDRPNHGRVDVLGPMGGPLVVAATDGESLRVQLTQSREHLQADAAEAVLREATGGLASVEDALIVIAGGLPFQGAEVTEVIDDGELGTRLSFAGPEKSTITAWLDPVTAAPNRVVAHDLEGAMLLEATYVFAQPPETEVWMPSEAHLFVPGLELEVDLKMRRWDVLETVPDVFTPDVPKGWSESALDEKIRAAVETELQR